jgi:hypothetical protein
MTSSGTYNFQPSNAQVVLSAFGRIHLRPPEIRAEHMNAALYELNYLQSSWSNHSPNLFEVIRTQTTLTAGTANYPITPQTVMILDASIVLNFGTSNESRRYITPLSRTEYLSLANQQTPGPPTQFWFDRLESPTITFYPIPDNGGPYTFDYFSCTQQQDAVLTGGQTPDVPYRWLDAVIAGLAYRLCKYYPPKDVPDPAAFEQLRKGDADQAWQNAAAQDTENVPFQLAPSLFPYYRR